MKAKVVVGANYGDEGKGLLTEHLCRLSSYPLVVLANGGCQRGHTIDNPKFGRHVFQHFGSGTFVGTGTYFAAEYKLNPMQFIKEYDELSAMLGGQPMPPIYANKNCTFQFPVDIFLNRFTESLRGKNRHGSVGAGIWETCLRQSYLRSRVNDVARSFHAFVSRYESLDWLITHLKYWSEEYFDYRIDQLAKEEFTSIGAKALRTMAENDPLYSIIFSDGMYMHFAKDCQKMFKLLKWLDYYELPTVCDTLIFEQGQGLCLDQEYCDDPRYATPSSPGLASTAPILGHPRIVDVLEEIVVEYVTRSYLTRHGAGPFPEEDPNMRFVDRTNMPNDWQGTLRFGKLDNNATIEMMSRISRDIAFFRQLVGNLIWIDKIPLKAALTVTHCNEVVPNKILLANATRLSAKDDSLEIKPNYSRENEFIDDRLFKYGQP